MYRSAVDRRIIIVTFTRTSLCSNVAIELLFKQYAIYKFMKASMRCCNIISMAYIIYNALAIRTWLSRCFMKRWPIGCNWLPSLVGPTARRASNSDNQLAWNLDSSLKPINIFIWSSFSPLLLDTSTGAYCKGD